MQHSPQATPSNPDATKTELLEELHHQVLNGELNINDANERLVFIEKTKNYINRSKTELDIF